LTPLRYTSGFAKKPKIVGFMAHRLAVRWPAFRLFPLSAFHPGTRQDNFSFDSEPLPSQAWLIV
jgi:hypothetical protein